MASLSRSSTLTPCRSSTPQIPAQPDHFYGSQNVPFPPSPNSDGKTWLDPEDDPLANRGIPVFKPTMEEFQDFEGYMNRVECWGAKSGIVKVIPPKEWTESLPDLRPQLRDIKINSPIEQIMLGNGGLFRQENMVRRKWMTVREWVELCAKEECRAPGIHEVGLNSRSLNSTAVPRNSRKGKQKATPAKVEASESGPADIVIKEEPTEDNHSLSGATVSVATPPNSDGTPPPIIPAQIKSKNLKKNRGTVKKEEPKARPKRVTQTRATRDANMAERERRNLEFLETFDPHKEWLPSHTSVTDYSPEFCSKLERHYWRNLGLGKTAWYGADTQGSLFTDATTAWNVAHLPSALSRLLPSASQGLPGVNTPYLYFGMWRATFSWHVEDMDLFSINYIHFGAPKFWYAIPQGRANSMEHVMRGYFPTDGSKCPQFLRHKSFLASPSILANSACRPNHLVQLPGEFVITFPRGYHAGFNLGLNCAESVNFALDSWIEVGRKAKACKCVSDSVRIDVDALLQEREAERNPPSSQSSTPKRTIKISAKKLTIKSEVQEGVIPPLKLPSRKRKPEAPEELPKAKKTKIKAGPSMLSTSKSAGKSTSPSAGSQSKSVSLKVPTKMSVTLKLGPRPIEPEGFPCCLCISQSQEGLLKVQDPPLSRKDAVEGASNPKVWMAHELCAQIIPETWVDEIDNLQGGKQKVVLGVDAIVKDRWNLKCSACTKNKQRAHGAPVQCTKGKCPKAFHVNCAKDGCDLGVVFSVIRAVDKEVVLIDATSSSGIPDNHMHLDASSASNSNGTAANAVHGNNLLGNRVLKVISKLEAQILCPQHNPAEAIKKKNNKQDRIRKELLGLPSMARIKIRVSAGVFEVSLIRVIEENGSVEVLWDKGLRKEFKWGSVVFGNTDGPVLQKPAEIAPDLPSAAVYPSVTAATHSSTTPTTPASGLQMTVPMNQQAYGNSTQLMYPARTGPYDYWSYASQQARYSGQTPYPYPYAGYYSVPPMMGAPQGYYGYSQAYSNVNANQYRNGQLHWQQPYQGPPHAQGSNTAEQCSAFPAQTPANAGPLGAQTPAQIVQATQSSDSTSTTSTTSISPLQSANSMAVDSNSLASVISNPSTTTGSVIVQDSGIQDLAALSSLPPERIAEILQTNTHLRDLVLAAVDQVKRSVI